MEKRRLIISEQAVEDLADIWLYIARDNVRAADRYIALLHRRCRGLLAWPEAGRQRDELLPGLRSLPVTSHIVFYRIMSAAVEIVRVLSGYRDHDSLF